ncbi:MAG: alpha/beta fold hydrolase [Oligosphaeraceae bacterium]|mgnify:CR=1 FL=1|nr:alpha/beta fold hydrolase [Oligosphaeraceae bacterium]
MSAPYQHMVLDYYVAHLRKKQEARSAELASLRDAHAAKAYQDWIKIAIDEAFAALPADKQPLSLQCTGSLPCDGYRLEKLLFESRPGFFVSALLYVPDEAKSGKVPAVLAPCGHAYVGKASEVYQGFAQRLAKNGFMVLAYDPIHQGERDQYVLMKDEPKEDVPGLCGAHNYMGKQLELCGDNFACWRVHDGQVALSVLLQREEVERRHVGVTGNSGGGTLSHWLWALDRRLTMAAPSCHLTTLLSDLENELPRDVEQYPLGLLAPGLELIDLMLIRAPAPAIMLGQRYDAFERRGFYEAWEEMERFYKLLGAEEKASMYMDCSTHGYSVGNQNAMVEFFCGVVGKEPRKVEVNPLPEEKTWVCPEGKVMLQSGAKSISELTLQKAQELAAERDSWTLEEMAQKLTELLQLPERVGLAHYRIPRPRFYQINGKEQVWARYAVETEEPGVRAIIHKNVRLPEHYYTLDVDKRVCIYLPDIASSWDIEKNSYLQELTEKEEVYAIDLRGLGESRPDDGSNGNEKEFLYDYGMDYMMHGYGLMLKQSYLGRRVFDLLRCIDLLAEEGGQQFILHGRGQGAVIAAFAALLEPRISKVILVDSPASFMEWIEDPLSRWPSAMHLYGVLKYFDLPDIIEALDLRVEVHSNWNSRRRRS